MKPNSNMTITGYTVDPTSQEISSLEVNGEAVETGGADLEDNKAATINVSTYTEPIEVTPTSGKESMKKATITLSNIPGGVPASLIRCTLYNNEETSSLNIAVENSNATSSIAYIDTFSGILYLLYRDGNLMKANYQISTDESGHKSVIAGSTYNKIKLGWD